MSASASQSAAPPPDTSGPAQAETKGAVSATTLDESAALAVRDGFPILAPTDLPEGWRVESVAYGVEGRGTWEVDMTDAGGAEVAVRQAVPGVPAAYVGDIATYLGSGARPVGTVDVPPLGTWDRYEGVRHPRAFAVGQYAGTGVVLWADDAGSLPVLASLLERPKG